MNPELKGIWQHMLDLGLGALMHANRQAAYAAMDNPSSQELSVLQAAHAAELLIKARIAQEHPLLIFEQLPRSGQASSEYLDIEDLFNKGRTVQWSDLPERLWATTGLTLPNLERFRSFGRLRNGIQHFAPPPVTNAGEQTLRFVFEVIDPFIHECWDLFAIDYDEDSEPYIYFVHALVWHEILFLVSPQAAESFDAWDVSWDSVSPEYKNEMHNRVKRALSTQKT